jgi:membrane protease YdiL (CAAX protease family)
MQQSLDEDANRATQGRVRVATSLATGERNKSRGMSVVDAAGVESKRPRRLLPFSIFLVSGLLLFQSVSLAFSGGGRPFQIATFIGLPLMFSIIAALLHRSRNFNNYWPAFSSYLIAAVALSCTWLLRDSPIRLLGFEPESLTGWVLRKASNTVVLVITVIILTRLLRVGFGSIYLQKGRLGLGLAIGFAGFAGMATLGVLEAGSLGMSMNRILGWTPWLLTFGLTHGFFEELIGRGLFLKKYESLVGPGLSNFATALVFAIGRADVTYTTALLSFVGLTFVFSLVAGYITQKTQSLWGSWLLHAGLDVVMMIAILASV